MASVTARYYLFLLQLLTSIFFQYWVYFFLTLHNSILCGLNCKPFFIVIAVIQNAFNLTHNQQKNLYISASTFFTTIIVHVINHGLSMRVAVLRVQQNLSCLLVASIVQIFKANQRVKFGIMQGLSRILR